MFANIYGNIRSWLSFCQNGLNYQNSSQTFSLHVLDCKVVVLGKRALKRAKFTW